MKATKIEMQVYETPSVEIFEVQVEQGFAISPTSTEDIIFGDKDNAWSN